MYAEGLVPVGADISFTYVSSSRDPFEGKKSGVEGRISRLRI
jgi:hypothetical protein